MASHETSRAAAWIAAGVWLLMGHGSALGGPSMAIPSRTIQFVPPTDQQPPPIATAIRIHPSGRWMVTAGDDHLIRVVETQTGQTIKVIRGHHDWIGAVDFSPDGRWLATAGRDRQVEAGAQKGCMSTSC